MSLTFMATPHLGCGLSPPPAPTLRRAGPLGEGAGRKGCMPRYWGKAGQRQRQEEQGSLRPGMLSSYLRTTNPCLRRNTGYSILSISPPTPALVLVPFRGAPLLVPMVWGILECLGNHGRLDMPTGGGMERKGCTQTLDEGDKRGAWWGAGAGGSVGVLGNWQGWGAGGRGRDRWS